MLSFPASIKILKIYGDDFQRPRGCFDYIYQLVSFVNKSSKVITSLNFTYTYYDSEWGLHDRIWRDCSLRSEACRHGKRCPVWWRYVAFTTLRSLDYGSRCDPTLGMTKGTSYESLP